MNCLLVNKSHEAPFKYVNETPAAGLESSEIKTNKQITNRGYILKQQQQKHENFIISCIPMRAKRMSLLLTECPSW